MNNRDPNEEGPYENGCHHWLADQITLTIEHDGPLQAAMAAAFQGVEQDMQKPPWLRRAETLSHAQLQQYALTFCQERMICRTHSLIHRAELAWNKAADEESLEESHEAYVDKEYTADLRNWLYRRFKQWLAEKELQQKQHSSHGH